MSDDFYAKMANGELVNLFAEDDGAIRRIEAFTNAVIVQMIYVGNDEETGEPIYQRVLSLMVRDRGMEPVLKREAEKLIGGIR